MLLGMAFVLSKQYSDDLSQKVTIVVRRSFEEGKSPAPKHGYIRDENGMYQPDGKNYDLICEAWEMRRQGTSLEQIADNMNKEGYARIVKKSGEKIYMTADILSTQVFPNPFYYGVLISEKTGKIVDLREAYTFTPATTEAVYNEIQLLSKRRTTPLQRRKRLTYYPLKAMVWCAFCSKNMVVGASTSKTGKRYLNYRCDNKQCTRKKKSIRGIKVFDFIYSFLEEGLKLTEKDYVEYYEKLNLLAGQKRQKLSIRLHSLEGSLKAITGEIKDRALGVINIANTRAKKVNEDRITELEAQEEQIKKDIMIIKKQLTDPEQDKLTLEQFLNLSKNAEEIAKSGDAVQKDIICREIFFCTASPDLAISSAFFDKFKNCSRVNLSCSGSVSCFFIIIISFFICSSWASSSVILSSFTFFALVLAIFITPNALSLISPVIAFKLPSRLCSLIDSFCLFCPARRFNFS